VVLVDTSVWSEVCRRRRPLDLEALVDFDSVVTCLPVIQEVMQGFRDDRAFGIAQKAMENLPILENQLGLDVVQEAVDLYRTARKNGLTVRSSVDCVIAACALRNDCKVLHRDRDFRSLARVSRLRERGM